MECCLLKAIMDYSYFSTQLVCMFICGMQCTLRFVLLADHRLLCSVMQLNMEVF